MQPTTKHDNDNTTHLLGWELLRTHCFCCRSVRGGTTTVITGSIVQPKGLQNTTHDQSQHESKTLDDRSSMFVNQSRQDTTQGLAGNGNVGLPSPRIIRLTLFNDCVVGWWLGWRLWRQCRYSFQPQSHQQGKGGTKRHLDSIDQRIAPITPDNLQSTLGKGTGQTRQECSTQTRQDTLN